MADNLKLEVLSTLSENSDYTDEEWKLNWDAYEVTPEEAQMLIVDATNALVTINLGHLTSGVAALFALKNTDPSNYAELVYDDIGSGSTNTVRCRAGGILVIDSLDPGTAPTLVTSASGVVVRCKILIAQ